MGSLSGGGSKKVKPTPMEIEMQAIADDEWLRYKERFVPIENALMDEIQTWDSNQEAGYMAGEASIMQNRGYGGMKSPIGMGMNQNTGSNFGLVMDNALKGGDLSGKAAGGAVEAARDRKAAGLTMLMNTGRNIKDTGAAGLSRGASIEAANKRAESRADWTEDRATQGAIGGGLGLATSFALPYAKDVSGVAPVFSGSQYNTNFGSEQSRMLAAQDYGLR